MSTKSKKKDRTNAEKYKPYLIYGIAALIVIIDQLTKFIVRQTMEKGSSIKLLPFFYLTHIDNTGSFFGIAKHSTGFLAFFSLIVIALILYGYRQIPAEKFLYVMIAFVLGGAIGNLIDRVFLGAVTDFFDFRIWPIFNIADSCITIAIIGLFWYVFGKEEKKD
jgi:signal peptidase II